MLVHWDEDLVVPVVDEMIDAFAARGEAELVSEFTYHYPAQVIAAILGLPREDHAFFHPRALAVINVAVRPEEGILASEELREYFAGIMDERRAHPGSDIISELTTAELDGERLGDEEIFSFLRLLLPAGAETTYRATGSFLYGLLTNPDQFAALAADRELMPQAIEETIRWEGPLLITSRECAADTDVAGVAIPRAASSPSTSGPPTTTRPVGIVPTSSTSSGPRSRTSRSVTASTCASGCISPGWRWRPRSTACWTAARTCGPTRTAGTPTTCTSTASASARPPPSRWCSTRRDGCGSRGRAGPWRLTWVTGGAFAARCVTPPR